MGNPQHAGDEIVETLESRRALQEVDHAAKHERVCPHLEHTGFMQIWNMQKERDHADKRRDEDNGDRDLAGSQAATDARAAREAVIEDARPGELKLLFDAERPEVLQRPHGGVSRVVVKEEEGAVDIDSSDGQATGPAKKQENGDVEIDGRQDAHGAPEIKLRILMEPRFCCSWRRRLVMR